VQLERGRALLDNPGDVPIDDIRDYVGRSIEKDQHRIDGEREADLADQKLIVEAAERVAEEEKKAAAAGRRTARVAVGGSAAALLVAAVGVWQYFQATEATQLAKAHLRASQIAQSRFLADLAQQQRAAANEGIAVLLALEALPDAAATNPRPYVSEAELQLDGASHDLRERLVLSHENQVLSAAFSPDGKQIVTASQDRTARIWNATTGLPIGGPLRGHEGWVRSAAFSPDGKRIVTASEDGTARI
jgi:transposase